MRFAADEIEKCCVVERNYVAAALQRRRGSEGRGRHAGRPLTPIRKSHQLNNKWIDGPRISTHSHVVHGVCTATVTAASIPTIESMRSIVKQIALVRPRCRRLPGQNAELSLDE